jgi:hypothetical protein
MSLIDKNIDKAIREYVHKRDEGKTCRICGKGYMGASDVVCHFIKTRHASTHYILENMGLGHVICNEMEEFDSELQETHQEIMFTRFGIEKVKQLHNLKNTELKMSISDKKDYLKWIKNETKKL